MLHRDTIIPLIKDFIIALSKKYHAAYEKLTINFLAKYSENDKFKNNKPKTFPKK